MKKYLVSILGSIFMLFSTFVCATAVEITLYTPSTSESEIMPSRDFYVVGSINRDGMSAEDMPLDIKIELTNSKGDVIRSVVSNVAPNGVTSAEYFMTDYDQGYSLEDAKGTTILQYPAPDIMYDGSNRDTIRYAHSKIVVKESYFAATIYGGASKEFDLIYADELENTYTDITEGEYTLAVIALDKNGDEICRYQQILTFGSKQGRVIASDNSLIEEYAQDNDVTVNNSIVGKWIPGNYSNAPKNFEYTIPSRYLANTSQEYGNADNVSVLLYNINPNNTAVNFKMGSAYSSESEKNYLYYDIGKPSVDFVFNGAELSKQGEIIKHDKEHFVEILRSETENDEDLYFDFNSKDGFVLTRNNKTDFYGVFSPFIASSSLNDGKYKLTDSVNFVKYTVTDDKGKTIAEEYVSPYVIHEDAAETSRYEFTFSITPDKTYLNSVYHYLTVSLCDSNKDEIFSGDAIALKINNSGKFITGYDKNYWGKSFCDVINFLGQNPAEEPLNPDEYITRGDFAAMINRLLGLSVTQKATFSDIDEDSVYYSDCATAQAAGYMTGDENGRVKADDFISREQAMIILARISEAEKGEKTVTFMDTDEISFWAKDYVDIMCSNGIVTGFDGYIHPTDSITVAEASALIIKTIKWIYGDLNINVSNSTDNIADDLSNIEFEDTEIMSDIGFESVSRFFTGNVSAFNSISSHIRNNCPNGAYINKVGNGLEMRDYALGGFISLSPQAIDVITKLSSKFVVFSIRYNPASEDAVHFVVGKNDDGKFVGLTYTMLDEAKGKELLHIDGNWYYYIQK